MWFEFSRPAKPIRGRRVCLRPPAADDYPEWSALRRGSRAFLEPWEPKWRTDHLTRTSFRHRVRWARRMIEKGKAYPHLIFRERDGKLVGGITIENVQGWPSMSASLGYWMGEPFIQRGYMTDALRLIIEHAFRELGISRLEAACVPENVASRSLLLRCGFHREGHARAMLEIDGDWRDHELYARVSEERAPSGDVDGSPQQV